MIQLTPEQIEYKERTLNQLYTNQAHLEVSLAQETRPDVIRSIQKQMGEIEEHLNRLQDELSGTVVFDEPVADEYFKKAVGALTKEKYHLANRYITKLETIEPFYPGLDRLKQEAGTRQVSRRTKSIAQGTATGYPTAAGRSVPTVTGTGLPPEQQLPPSPDYFEEPPPGRFGQFFQFHIVASCLVVVLIMCLMLGIGGMMFLQWLIEGGA